MGKTDWIEIAVGIIGTLLAFFIFRDIRQIK
jgi:hypothetical protein